MKSLLTKHLLLLTVIAFTIKAGAAERWETLRAINWVENPTNQTHVGRCGELGPYQFRPGTWRMHTSRPFNQAVERAAADEVAVKHYEWIKRTLERAGVEASSFNIAMAWNCGVDAVVAGRIPSASFNYATRVNNLAATFKERTPPVETEAPGPAAPNLDLNLDEHTTEVRFRIMQDAPRFVLAAD